MTAMETALRTAGVPVPSKMQRLWQWVKDHPGKTTRDVAAATGINHDVASISMRNMAKRGSMRNELTVEFSPKAGHDVRVARFYALGDTYATWGPGAKTVAKKHKAAPTPPVMLVPPAPALSPVEAALATVMQMKVADVLELRKRLDKLLGG